MYRPVLSHLSQQEEDGRLFGHNFLEIVEFHQRLLVPLHTVQDGGALKLAQRTPRRQFCSWRSAAIVIILTADGQTNQQEPSTTFV